MKHILTFGSITVVLLYIMTLGFSILPFEISPFILKYIPYTSLQSILYAGLIGFIFPFFTFINEIAHFFIKYNKAEGEVGRGSRNGK